jgi:hypothetical protein
MDSRTCQTSAASPAEPGGLPFGLVKESGVEESNFRLSTLDS